MMTNSPTPARARSMARYEPRFPAPASKTRLPLSPDRSSGDIAGPCSVEASTGSSVIGLPKGRLATRLPPLGLGTPDGFTREGRGVFTDPAGLGVRPAVLSGLRLV